MSDHISPPALSFEMGDGKHHVHFWTWIQLADGRAGPAMGVGYPGAIGPLVYVDLIERHALLQMMGIMLAQLSASDWDHPKPPKDTNVIPFLRKR